jgi:hypothetical protein
MKRRELNMASGRGESENQCIKIAIRRRVYMQSLQLYHGLSINQQCVCISKK